ncbi:MAG: hypothetical protein IIZ39_03995, partial [Blautia sp.]|nr:hypothetical protein [Blautia sp.]
SEIVDKLVTKGESTVEEGKQLNSALAHKVQTGAENLRGGVLLKYMRSMTIEQRKEFVKKVVEISDQLDKEEESDFSSEKPESSCEGKNEDEAKASIEGGAKTPEDGEAKAPEEGAEDKCDAQSCATDQTAESDPAGK